MVILALFS